MSCRPLPRGHSIDIINTHGNQVVDFWAFVRADPTEHLSMPHCRSCLEKLHFTKGDALYSSNRRKILEITEDTSPGVHDSLLSACPMDVVTTNGADCKPKDIKYRLAAS